MSGNTLNHTDLIWPARRKFIQRAPLAFAAGLTLAAMPKAARAFAGVAGSQPMGGELSPTTLGSAFPTSIFYDDFNDLSSIDLNNSLVPGFKWYMQGVNYSGNGTPYIQSPASVSISNSILTLNPDGKESSSLPAGGGLNSVGFNGNGLVGTCMPYTGGYYGIRCAYDVSLSPGGGNAGVYWPAFWFNDASPFAAYNSAAPLLPYPSVELDIMELFPGSNPGTANNTGTLHQHSLGGVAERVVGTFSAAPSNTAFHTYEAVVKTQYQNGGTGNVKLYIDNVRQVSIDYSSTTGSPTGNGAWLDTPTDPASRGFNLMIWTKQNWPLHTDWVSVRQ